jgi:inosine/xanthosine triphosphatase
MNLIVGTENPIKIKAVENVFTKYFPQEPIAIQSVKVNSEVSNQPIGLNNVIDGAINRAKHALKYFIKHISKSEIQDNPSQNKTLYAIGIESGLIQIPSTISGYLAFQYSAIIDQEKNLSIGTSPGWEYPSQIVNQLLTNSSLEMGTIMADLSGDKKIKYKEGAIGYFTQNKLNRLDITEMSIEMAIIPHINKKFYFSL